MLECMLNARRVSLSICVFAVLAFCTSVTAQDVRLYVFDNGVLEGIDPTSYQLAKGEVAEPVMSCASYLIVHTTHGKTETLVWDSGAISDADIEAGRRELQQGRLTLKASTTLRAQLATAGYAPGDITYFALSHSHFDHTANANAFASATWIVQRPERAAMFPASGPSPSVAALHDAKTKLLDGADYDVFGDGTVVVKAAYGHTPGHQVLFVKLRETGPVILAGDLYHYRAQVGTPRVAAYEFNKAQTAASRVKIEALVRRTGAQLWIEHDLEAFRKLKKAPAYYQ